MQCNVFASLYTEAQGQDLIWEQAGWNSQLHQVLLVLFWTKAQVSALLGGLTLPGDSRFQTTNGNTGAGPVHLSQVNHNPIDLHKELVFWTPVINLVQGKLNGDPVSLHCHWAGAARHSDSLGHLICATSQPAQELGEAN